MASSASSSVPTAAVVQDTNFSNAVEATAPQSARSQPNYGSTTQQQPSADRAASNKPTTTSSRAIAPDLLRGLILPLMSLDHAALFMGAWLHGTPKQTESAATPMTQWNFNTAYVSRTITHLCAPGFFFLMGMGTVYFHRSRARIGWGKARMVKHFVVRAIALTLVSEVMGESLMWGRKIWVINIVLIGLAVDYLLTGLLCLVVDATEGSLAKAIDGHRDGKSDTQQEQESRPLLRNSGSGVEEQRDRASAASSERSRTLSFWIHNGLLAILTYITIFWNVWLSPTHGHCPSTSMSPTLASANNVPIELFALLPVSANKTAPNSPPPAPAPTPMPSPSRFEPWFDFWFFPVQNSYVMSGFPPLGWISFCLFGMLYARVMLYKRWTPRAVISWNLGVAVFLAAFFVATRLLHFGNLSEGCLHMPEHIANPHRNQYLTSIKSFFYITKYPPSPSFFALTMAVNFALLAIFSAIPPNVAIRIPGLMNFGGSALFFYVAHMYLYSLLSIPARYFFSHPLPDQPPNPWERTTGLGASAPFWLFWILGLVILNPMCKAYGRFKSAQSTDSLWRFF